MRAILKSKKKIAKGTMLFEYQTSEDVHFKPGQHFFVNLGNNLVHHFTIVNSPNKKRLLSNATRMRNTDFKNTLKDLEIGAEVEVDRIGGNFVLPQDTSKPLVFIALGIGITPFISMLRYIKEVGSNYKLTLIYSDSDKESMVFFDEFKYLEKENRNLKVIFTVTNDFQWIGEKRHVDGNFIKDYLDNLNEYIYYVAGPPEAVESVVSSLEKSGIPKENINKENFSGY